MSFLMVVIPLLINCLNPYYTGSYSMRFTLDLGEAKSLSVLILIILEVTL